MKKRTNIHPAEQGAGFALILVCIVVMLIDSSLTPVVLMFNALGLMMVFGLFSGSSTSKRCNVHKLKDEKTIE